jgi:hypothetical protein
MPGMKVYYSCPDTGFVKQVPQPLQHLAIGSMAEKLGGKVVFYTMEDFETLASQGVIRHKVMQHPDIHGVIFFRLQQFCYGERPNLAFVRMILQAGYELHFARENLSLTTPEAADAFYPLIYSHHYLAGRDENRAFWQPVWDWLDRRQARLVQAGTV